MSTEVHQNRSGTAREAPARDERPPGARPRRGKGLAILLAALTMGGVLVLGGLALVARLAPSLLNPFAAETVDRSRPAVLQALEDLSEYRAATGHFEVILDIEDDARFLPRALVGERTLFVAVGSVDATVDFEGIGEGSVDVSDDRMSAVIRLPSARLSDARVDPEDSYVFERERGLLDRLGSLFSDSPTSERELYLLAEDKLMAAAEDSDLAATAERNTRAMLESLLGSLGFTDVTVVFG